MPENKPAASTKTVRARYDAPEGHTLTIDGKTVKGGDTIELTADELARAQASGATVTIEKTRPGAATGKGRTDKTDDDKD